MDPTAPTAPPAAPRRPLDETLHALLASFGVRLFLSACIIVSLLPFPWVPHLDGLFLLIFGAEFLTRLLALFRGHPGEPGASEEVESVEAEGGGRRWRLPSSGAPTWPPPSG